MMRIYALDLSNRSAKPLKRPELLAAASLGRTYFPGRGLPFSIVIHVIAFTIVYNFASFPVALAKRPEPQDEIVMIDLNDPASTMFLPFFDGGRTEAVMPKRQLENRQAKPAEPVPEVAKAPEPEPEPAEPPSTTTQGFSYPGPQPVISDVEQPTNRFQTLLQPDLDKPPILAPPLIIPNVVQMASAIKIPRMEEPPPPPEPEEPEPEPKPVPVPKPEPKPVEQPKPEPTPVPVPKVEPKPAEPPKPEPKPVELPKSEPTPVPAPKVEPKPAEPPKPEPKPVELPKPEPKPEPKPVEQPKPEPTPVPVPKPEPKPPEPAPNPAELPKPAEPQKAPQVPGSPAAKSAPTAAPALEQKAAGPPKEASQPPALPAASKDILSITPVPAAPGAPVQIPSGEARGRFVISPNPDLTASDAEPGFKSGTPSSNIGIGNTIGAPARKGVASKNAPAAPTGKGPAGGSTGGKPVPDAGAMSPAGSAGNGPGTAPVKKPFAGITIVGGEYEPGSDPDVPPVTRALKPLQTAYGLSIISTEGSGGGLPYFDVFSNEQIYTVYLDMRTVETDQDPSWTLEFALMQDLTASSAIVDLGRTQQGFVLPFPSVKEKPAWPAGLARKYAGRMIVVYGVINAAGKMEQISIKDSPDPLLNDPVIKALAKWTFRPAQSEGRPVPAKALFGIPLWAPE